MMMLSRENSVDRTVAYAPYVSVHKELVQQAIFTNAHEVLGVQCSTRPALSATCMHSIF